MKKLSAVFALIALMPVLTQASVTLDLAGGTLYKNDGITLLPAGATVALIADRDGDGFGDFINSTTSWVPDADDLLVARFAMNYNLDDGVFNEVVGYDYSGTFGLGDDLLIAWWDVNYDANAAGPGQGIYFGYYRTDSVSAQSSIGFEAPADGGAYTLWFLAQSLGFEVPDAQLAAQFQTTGTNGGGGGGGGDPTPISDTSTWSGGGGNNFFSSTNNWDTALLTGTNPKTIVFSGTNNTTAVNDLAGLSLAGMQFANGAAAFTLSGTDLSIVSGGSIINNSGTNQTIGMKVTTSGDLTVNAASGDLLMTGGVAVTGSTVTVTGSSNTVISGPLTGTGTVAKSGTGTLELSGSNGFTGTMLLQSGELRLSSGVSLADAMTFNLAGGTFTNNTGGALTLNNATTISGNISIGTGPGLTLSNSVNLAGGARQVTLTDTSNGAYLRFNGPVTNGALAVTGTGQAVQFTSSNGFSGGTFTGVVVGVGDNNALGTGPVALVDADLMAYQGDRTISSNIIVSGTVDIVEDTTPRNLTLAGGVTVASSGVLNVLSTGSNAITGGLALGGNTLNINTSTNSMLVSGAVTGTGGLIKSGDGALYLTGSSSYSGGTTMTGGLLAIGGGNALGSGGLSVNGGTLRNISGGALTLGNAVTLTSNVTLDTASTGMNFTGGVNLGSGTRTISLADTNANSTLGLQGIANGGLVVTGSGNQILALTGSSGYAGGTTLSGVMLAIGHTNALGTGGLTMTGGTLFARGVSVSVGNSITAQSDLSIVDDAAGAQMLTLSGNIAAGANQILVNSGTNVALAGSVSGGGPVVKSGSGTLFLSGSNSFSGGTQLNAGALAIGHDQALGSGALALANGVSVSAAGATRTISNDVSAAGEFTIASNIGGAQALNFTGNLTLNQSNTVNLASGAATTFSGPVAIGANTLTINAHTGGQGLAISGLITGSGVILKYGPGSLTLAGTNTGFSGGVTLNAGSLLIGNTNALGTGTLTMSGTNAEVAAVGGPMLISNAVQLNGNFIVASAPTPHALTFSGPITVNGNHAIGNANTAGTAFAGTVSLSNNVLSLDTYDNSTLTISGNIVGSGDVLIAGSGRVAYVGNKDFTGGTIVNDTSTLILNGNVAGSVLLQDNAILMGAGTIGGDLTVNGGTVKPGFSPGTIVVNGDFNLNTGSVLDLEVDNTGGVITSDLIIVNGDANFASGSTINFIATGDTPLVTGDEFTVLTVSGAINGTPTITSSSAFLSFSPTNNGSSLVFSVQQVAAFASAADSANHRSIAENIDDGGLGNSSEGQALVAQLQLLDTAGFNEAVETLSPQSYGTLPTANLYAAQTFNFNLANHFANVRAGVPTSAQSNANPFTGLAALGGDPFALASAIDVMEAQEDENAAGTMRSPVRSESGLSVFARGFGVFTDDDGDTDRTGFRSNTGGGMFGIDYQLDDHIILGVTGGGAFTDLDFKGGLGESDVQSFRVGPYASMSFGRFFVDAAATFGIHDIESERNVAVGPITYTAESDSDAWDFSGYLAFGYEMRWDRTAITPMLAVQYLYYEQDGFSESGAGPANLTVSDFDADSLRTMLGVRVSRAYELADLTLVPEISVGWVHEYLGNEADITASFGGSGTPFGIRSEGLASDSVIAGAGLNVLFSENVSAFIRYDGEFRSDGESHAASGGLTIGF